MQGLEQELSYLFKDKNLLTLALTHKSFANELGSRKLASLKNNELLEYLGDAVLDLAMSELLMKHFPKSGEGSLSKKRASLVNEEILSSLAKQVGLDKALLLGKGERASGGATKPRLLACAFEAVVGAVFQDSNYETVKQVIFRLFDPIVANYQSEYDFEKDYKTRLQELTQKEFNCVPSYEVYDEIGPAHCRNFYSQLYVDGKWIARAIGRSKKAAEQYAAKKALEVL